MDINGLDNKRAAIVTVVAVATAAIVLFGGFAISSVHAKTIVFRTDFETSLAPACFNDPNEEVFFHGTAQFVADTNAEKVHMIYVNVKGENIDGTKYVVTEHDKYFTLVNEDNGDITFKTSINGNFISSGPGINTMVEIKLITVLHANGDEDTIVDQASVKCPPESTGPG